MWITILYKIFKKKKLWQDLITEVINGKSTCEGTCTVQLRKLLAIPHNQQGIVEITAKKSNLADINSKMKHNKISTHALARRILRITAKKYAKLLIGRRN